MDLLKYHAYIFDLDGVILDSNRIKEKAIKLASNKITDRKKADDFLEYFTSNNGITREKKIKKYFNKSETDIILNKYSKILSIDLMKAQYVRGAKKFIQFLFKNNKDLYVLSGGDEQEVTEILNDKNISQHFKMILGGPKSKRTNLKSMPLDSRNKVIYFGDSKIDYEIAIENDFDFTFIYGSSSMEDWKEKINLELSNCFYYKDFGEINC